jgi:multidrug efflux pump subunit AcrA (membrane-fusion protein)
VRELGQLTMVKVLVDGQTQNRQVKLGRQVGDQMEVLAGLQAGDRIMLQNE